MRKRHEEIQDRREEWMKECDAKSEACEEKQAQFWGKLEERGEEMQERRGNAPVTPTKQTITPAATAGA